MCRESIEMLKVCGQMPSEARLEKIGVYQSIKGQFTLKYFIFREIWNIPCVVQIFPVLYLNSVFSLSGKSENQIPCFLCAVATLLDPSSSPLLFIPCYSDWQCTNEHLLLPRVCSANELKTYGPIVFIYFYTSSRRIP